MPKRKPEPKTREQRELEVQHIIDQLEQLGLTSKLPGIAKLMKIMDDYIQTGNGASGKIKLPEAERTIHYIFSIRKHIEPKVSLLVD